MTTTDRTHFLEYLFASDMRSRADQPLLYERQNAAYHIATLRETAARIADFARALSAVTVGMGDRVAFYAAASPSLLIGEWGVLASRAVAVIIPRTFSQENLAETVAESKSKLAIVDRLATAYHLAQAGLPDLKHVVCLEGSAEAPLPISSWSDFIDAGRMQPDRSTGLLRSIEGKDTALLFYYKDAKGNRQATRYTHALLLDHIARIESILAASSFKKGELVLSATTWEHAVGHIACCYAPVPKDAVVQVTYGVPDISLFENSPQVVVGDAMFFDGMRENVIRLVRQSGSIESAMLNKAISISKQGYESNKGVRGLPRLQRGMLEVTIVKKVKKMLGEKLRLFVGIDNEAHYDTQLFFHAFGVELIELPQEVFREK